MILSITIAITAIVFAVTVAHRPVTAAILGCKCLLLMIGWWQYTKDNTHPEWAMSFVYGSWISDLIIISLLEGRI